MTVDFDPAELVPKVQCSDCGRLVPAPADVTADLWRCYDCGWGAE